jgi:adenylosuccinate lyase
VYPENMLANLAMTHGLIFSQPVLLALTQKGMRREDAYRLVQKNAMEVWHTKEEFKDLLKADTEITAILSHKEIDELFDLTKSTKHVEAIFKRIGLT